jgi:excisionase family DNA binding protein
MTDRLLTARQVADRLGVSAETVLRWTRRGALPGFKLPGGPIRYRDDDLVAWLDAHKTAGDGPEEVSSAPDATHRQPQYPSRRHLPRPRTIAATTEEEP